MPMYPSEQDTGSSAGATAALGTIVVAILLACCGSKSVSQKRPEKQEEKKPTPMEKTTNSPALQKQIYASFYAARR